MSRQLLRPVWGACLLAFAFTSAPVVAQEVRLTAPDGNRITGRLIDFDGQTYQLEVTGEVVEISADLVECDGEACPVVEPFKPEAVVVRQPSIQLLPENLERRIVASGSSTFGVGLMPLLVSGYASIKNAAEERTRSQVDDEFISYLTENEGFGEPLASIRVRSSVTSDAFANMIGRSAHLGMASRRVTPAEAQALSRYGAGNMISPTNEHIVAVDSLVVIVNPENPVDSLSLAQLQGIYGGEITNWSDVGGPNAPILVVDLPDGSGTRNVFDNRIFESVAKGTPANRVVVENNTDASNQVNADPSAIAYVSYAFLRGTKPVTLINECNLPMIPDTFSARTEEYGLQRFLYLYSHDDTRDQTVQDFVDFATSPDADGIIAKTGFIDLGITRRAQPVDGVRGQQIINAALDPFERRIAENMLAVLPDYDRLSSTFRFRLGSSALTPRGELNLSRLTRYLEAQPEGTRILIVGFTDSLGPFSSNLNLAIERAEQVRGAIQTFAGDRLAGIGMEVVGFGELAPTACNEGGGRGSRINRRVEIWIENQR